MNPEEPRPSMLREFSLVIIMLAIAFILIHVIEAVIIIHRYG